MRIGWVGCGGCVERVIIRVRLAECQRKGGLMASDWDWGGLRACSVGRVVDRVYWPGDCWGGGLGGGGWVLDRGGGFVWSGWGGGIPEGFWGRMVGWVLGVRG